MASNIASSDGAISDVCIASDLSLEARERLAYLMDHFNPLCELLAKVNGDGRARRTRRRHIRLPPAGSFIRRTYRGREIAVRVLDTGFEYEGERFRSLSAIAKAVTGAHWNGNLFFGFVNQKK